MSVLNSSIDNVNLQNIYRVDTLKEHFKTFERLQVVHTPHNKYDNVTNEQVSMLSRAIDGQELNRDEAIELIHVLREKAIYCLDSIDYKNLSTIEKSELLNNVTQMIAAAEVAKDKLDEIYGQEHEEFIETFSAVILLEVKNGRAFLQRSLSWEEEEVSVVAKARFIKQELENQILEELKKLFIDDELNLVHDDWDDNMKKHLQVLFLKDMSRPETIEWIREFQRLSGALNEDENYITGSIGRGLQSALTLAYTAECLGLTGEEAIKAVLTTLKRLVIERKIDYLNSSDCQLNYEVQEIENAEHVRLREIYDSIHSTDCNHRGGYDLIGRGLINIGVTARSLLCKGSAWLYPSFIMAR